MHIFHNNFAGPRSQQYTCKTKKRKKINVLISQCMNYNQQYPNTKEKLNLNESLTEWHSLKMIRYVDSNHKHTKSLVQIVCSMEWPIQTNLKISYQRLEYSIYGYLSGIKPLFFRHAWISQASWLQGSLLFGISNGECWTTYLKIIKNQGILSQFYHKITLHLSHYQTIFIKLTMKFSSKVAA